MEEAGIEGARVEEAGIEEILAGRIESLKAASQSESSDGS